MVESVSCIVELISTPKHIWGSCYNFFTNTWHLEFYVIGYNISYRLKIGRIWNSSSLHKGGGYITWPKKYNSGVQYINYTCMMVYIVDHYKVVHGKSHVKFSHI
jgi:hypothetical protein